MWFRQVPKEDGHSRVPSSLSGVWEAAAGWLGKITEVQLTDKQETSCWSARGKYWKMG